MEFLWCFAYPALIPQRASRASGTDWATIFRAYRRSGCGACQTVVAPGCIFNRDTEKTVRRRFTQVTQIGGNGSLNTL